MKRIYHYLAVLLLASFATGLQAQTPSGISINGVLQHVSASSGPRMCNEAGTITFGQHIGQSNDVGQTVKYLCFGDTLFVNHDGNFDLSGDPQPATPPGIGYVFYDCPPTQSGPNLAAVLTDACINGTDPIVVGGNPIPQTGGMWVATQNPNGNITLINNGGLQSAFNNGVPMPIQFWFAPITLDQFASQGFENGGPCVDVNTEEAFSIVYLNAITATNQMVNQGASGCEGSFVVRGGLPEFDNNSTDYTIDISLQSNPSVKGTTNSVATHGSTIQFVVPQPGIYVISVEDGKSCGATFTMDMSTCQAVTFSFPLINASPGTNICVPITVQDFVNVGSMQFTMVWDGAVLDFTNINAINPNVTGLDNNAFNNMFPPTNDTLTFSWADISFNGVDLNDGETLVELCFDVIGALGDCSPLNFADSPTSIEIGDPGIPQPNIYGFIGINGKVNVSNDVIFLVSVADSVSCPGLADGAFTATVAAGTAPYQLTWRRLPAGPVNGPFAVPAAGSMFTANNLQAGLYEITVMDSNNPANMSRDTAEILSGPVLGVQIQGTSPRCFGESNGSVTAVVTLDGVATPNPGPGYVYHWNTMPDPGSVPVLMNLPFGFYAVTVTDPGGCTAMASATLSQPAPLTVTGPNTNILNATCEGAENGSITIMATGGTSTNGTYTFTWNNGLGTVIATNSQVGNLDPGQYCVTVTDANGCMFNNCYTVGAQKILGATPVVTDASCNGVTDGEIFVTGTASGAAAVLPFTFTWSQVGNPPVNNNTSSQLTGLAAGSYTLTLTDSDPAGCEIVRTFMVNEPQPLVASILEQVNETCVVGNDGSITVGVTGGTFPYTYNWSHDATLQDSIATGLTQNSYSVDITDANGCTGMLTANILAPTPPTIVSLLDDTVSCPEDTDGTLTVNATAGGAPIAGYSWTGGGVTQTINNLAPGTYVVTVTAEDGCFSVDTAQVLSPLPLTLDSTSLRLPDCPGDGNGRITVFASGGTLPYTYTWSTTGVPGTLNPLPGLSAGTYSVTVNDANGCAPLIVPMIVLPDPPSINVTFSGIAQVSCPDDQSCDGRATATALYSDGTAGQFNFTWSSGETAMNAGNASASQLCRGAQSVTVSDGVCGVILPVTIPSPQDITIGVLSTAVSCNGLGDGAITLTPAGGTGPYDFLWSPSGQITPTVNGLIAGVYTAIVTDANGCTRTQNVEISEPDELILSLDPNLTTPTVSCADGTDGIISVVFNSGQNINPIGNAPFTWSNGVAPAISSIANNLAPGTYSVTITDIKGCRDSLTYTISEPPPLVVVIVPPVAPLCFGDATQIIIDTIYGGTGMAFLDYTFEIDNNGLSFPPDQSATVFAGPHIVTIEDPAGCRVEQNVNIDQPAEIEVILPAEIVVELGDTTARLNPIVVSSLPIDAFLWTPDTYLSSDTVQSPFIRPLSSGDYNLLVTDINGCTGTADIFVELDANRNVYIPNIFSPNGDGPNDEFRIFACTGVTSINSVLIFDRWGGMVYEANSLLPICEGGLRLWDGKRNGKVMNPGVYVYVIEIEFLDGVKLLYRGDITLLR